MTIRTESALTVGRDIATVWAYLCDVGRWPEWAPTVRRAWIDGGGPLVPGARIRQRAKGILGSTFSRAQRVTAVDGPHRMAFAGPMGISKARWGMRFDPAGDQRTEAMMWVEVDLTGVMRTLSRGGLQGRIQRVSDREMIAIKRGAEAESGEGRA